MPSQTPPEDSNPAAAVRSRESSTPGARSADALDELFPLVYDELRRVAHRQLAAEHTGHTLSTTALVHEAWFKLADQRQLDPGERGRFFALAAQAMRRILIDYARRHLTHRRGGGQRRLSLDLFDPADQPTAPGGHSPVQIAAAERSEELLALDEALARLAAVEPRLAQVVELRFFAGLTEAETAGVLGVTARTVTRDWVAARGWLFQELRDTPPDGA
jgi:RNA polymerase sigma factor (TIGR02999 family)